MAYKLYDRRGKSCSKLSFYQDAVKDLTQAQKLARDHILDESKLTLFLKDTDKYLKSCASMVQMSHPFDFQQKNLPMLTGINSSMPSLSPAVNIEYSHEVLKTF